jgi:hypothetical protein
LAFLREILEIDNSEDDYDMSQEEVDLSRIAQALSIGSYHRHMLLCIPDEHDIAS